jgi:dihydroorotate dehydrogenase (fumarate)
MTDLSTTYMGLTLANPLVPSASPLCRSLDNLRRMEDAGAGAVVLHSLFEEQIDAESQELDECLVFGAHSYAEALDYFPEPATFRLTPDRYLDHVRRAKEAVAIPVIGSLNGVSRGGWVRYAREIEQAGADALELNVYSLPTDPRMRSADIEQTYVDLLLAVRQQVRIPVAVKLSPYLTNMVAMAHRLDEAGAAALVLFNRFYQPDIDLETLAVVPRATISGPDALRLPLRWIAILYGRVQTDLAASSGVRSAEDALKALLAGASVTMLASELLVNGIDRLRVVRQDLLAWLEAHEYVSVAQLRGSMSHQRVAFPSAFERAHYLRLVADPAPEVAGGVVSGGRLAPPSLRPELPVD